MHTLHVFAGFAIALMVCAVLVSAPALQWAPAHAQKLTEVKKKVEKRVEKKAPPPKDTPKEQQERNLFTVEDEAVAVIPGIADARAWGDSATDFTRLLPQASGPWLAISGGGSDGGFGGGGLTGWTESGTRPEFAVVTGASIGALIAPLPSWDRATTRRCARISPPSRPPTFSKIA